MNSTSNNIFNELKHFCARIGSDRLLVQGAGGNISWKDNNTLWIKASGKWLARASTEEIFLPVSLPYLREAIENKKYGSPIPVLENTPLRPSIETMLHAVMGHKIVAHLHAVEALAHLVTENAEKKLEKLIGGSVRWAFVDYYKPGAELASKVYEKLELVPDADVVFLKNHGIVVGAADILNLSALLEKLSKLLLTKPYMDEIPNLECFTRTIDAKKIKNFHISSDQELNLLSRNPHLISRLQRDWALYPDHVVFLGREAIIVDEVRSDRDKGIIDSALDFVFIKGFGLLVSDSITPAKEAQLRCYYDVIIRQAPGEQLDSLSEHNIKELLNWEAEHYRVR